MGESESDRGREGGGMVRVNKETEGEREGVREREGDACQLHHHHLHSSCLLKKSL